MIPLTTIISHPALAVIGAGNMGSALISGLIAADYPSRQIWATTPSQQQLESLKQKFAISVTTDNKRAAEQADILLFAVKPALMATVAQELAAVIQVRKPLIISIAAGIPLSRLAGWLGEDIAILRAMPNTPAVLGCGACALYANPQVSAQQRQLAEIIFNTVGITVWLDNEKQMDSVTALSGSGPAYFFLFMEALEAAAKKHGLPAQIAHQLTVATAYGAARLSQESQAGLESLRQQVTSPQGTTAAAIEVLEKNNLRGLIEEAMLAARKRAEELSSS